MHWYCSNCELDAVQAVQNDAHTEEHCQEFLSKYECRIAAVEEKVDEKADKTKVDTIGSQVEALNDQIKSMAVDIDTLNKKIGTVLFEKIKRRNNILIRGLPQFSDISDTNAE